MSLKAELNKFYRKFRNRPPITVADPVLQEKHARDVTEWMALVNRLMRELPSGDDARDILTVAGKCVSSLFDLGDDITAWLSQREIASAAEVHLPGPVAAYHLSCAAQLSAALYLYSEADGFLERMRSHFNEMDHAPAAQYWRLRGLILNLLQQWEEAVPNYILSIEHLEKTMDSELKQWFDFSRENLLAGGNLAITDCWINLGWQGGSADRVRCCANARKYLEKSGMLTRSPLQKQLHAVNEIEVLILEEHLEEASTRIDYLFKHVPSSRRAAILHPSLHCMKARVAFIDGNYTAMIGHLSQAVAESTMFPNALQELMIIDYAIRLIRDASVHRELLQPLLEAMVLMLEAKDWYTGRDHSRSVAELSAAIWEKAGNTSGNKTDNILYWAGYLHDIGKLRLPRSLLNKIAPLHDSEWQLLRRHPTYGKQLLENFRVPRIAQLVSEHHQDQHGGGYPGDSPASMMGMCIAIADFMEAATSPSRKYKRPKTVREALAELKRQDNRYPETLISATEAVYAGMS